MDARNPLILQTFEWHTPLGDESHYRYLIRLLPSLARLGVTSFWLPPGSKANNPRGNGYDIYDLWDLGEFHQKGSRRTKWGDREDLDRLIKTAKDLNVDVIWDAVLNHKAGADGTSEVWAVEVDKEDRRYEICPPKKIEAWLRFDFSGRQQEEENLKHSQFQWQAEHFNGVDWDHRDRNNAIYKLIDDPATLSKPFDPPKRPRRKPQQMKSPSTGRRLSTFLRRFSSDSGQQFSRPSTEPAQRPGKGWMEDVDKEHGNNDYLMFSNIDYTHPEVREDAMNWGQWMIDEVSIDGFRLDAVQHFSFSFTKGWIQHVHEAYKRHANNAKHVFVVGEVWSGELHRITTWLDAVQVPSGHPQIFAFDAPLLYNFSRISQDVQRRSKNVDLRTILHNSLLETRPKASVTLVTNHDTQPGQVCYAPMPGHLKPLWYAFILLRKEGLPCVFWGDLLGTHGPHAEPPIGSRGKLDPDQDDLASTTLAKLMLCRKHFAFGEQTDYWHSSTSIGWVRSGRAESSGCAVVSSTGSTPKTANKIMMIIGASGETWLDVMGLMKDDVTIDAKGVAAFPVSSAGVSVWVRKGTETMVESRT